MRAHRLYGLPPKGEVQPMALMKGMTVKDLVEAFARAGAYNAGRLAEACKLYERMLEEDATIALTLAGAMSPAGMGGPIISLMEGGFIDLIVSTGANLYHDLNFAFGMPIRQGDFRVDDRLLWKEGVVRIYDLFVSEEDMLQLDRFLRKTFSSTRLEGAISTAELHHIIGEAVLKEAKHPERSLVAQAAKWDVPIYTPSPGDSSIGMSLAALKLDGGSIIVDTDLDVLETAAIVFKSAKNGAIIIGGGAPKNFYLQTQPNLSEVLGLDKKGHDYMIQITMSRAEYGGQSGATPQEAISWGKVKPHSMKDNVVVYADATIAAPILFGYVLSVKEKRPLKRLYPKKEGFLRSLRRSFTIK